MRIKIISGTIDIVEKEVNELLNNKIQIKKIKYFITGDNYIKITAIVEYIKNKSEKEILKETMKGFEFAK